MFKISGNFLLLLVLFFLGFTHFLGGPYVLAKIFFFLMLFGTFIFSIIVIILSIFAGKFISKGFSIFRYRKINEKAKNEETIKVDAKVVE